MKLSRRHAENYQCPECDTEVSLVARFCPGCGEPLAGDVADEADEADQVTAPRSRWRRVVPYLLGVVILALVASGTLLALRRSHHPAIRHAVTGTMTLHSLSGGISGFTDGGDCHGAGGFSDMAEGASVVVKDDHGVIVGTDALRPGLLTQVTERFSALPSAKLCTFQFTVSDLPDRPYYTIEVSHRGGITHSRAELEATNWIVGLTLGS